MNATTISNAIKLAQKPAAIGFISILGLGITTALASAISALLALLVPVLLLATKAAIFGYLPFLAGLIALKIKQQRQTKETHTIALLPPSKPYPKRNNQEEIENDVLIANPPIETIFKLYTAPKQRSWEQWILDQIQLETSKAQSEPEIKEVLQPIEKPAKYNIKPLSNRLASSIVCWQAFNQVSELLSKIKASELKSIASELQIPKYRNMNKSQLLLEIIHAQECAPEFSQ
jgi:hypothetical protein